MSILSADQAEAFRVLAKLTGRVEAGEPEATQCFVELRDELRDDLFPQVSLTRSPLKLSTPIIHLNGSAGNTLFEQAREASDAIREAIKVASRAWPNPRDYYPLGNKAIHDAESAHKEALDRLQSVREAFESLAEAILDQIDSAT